MPNPPDIVIASIAASSKTQQKVATKFQTSMETGFVNTVTYAHNANASDQGKRLLVLTHKDTGGDSRVAAGFVVTSFPNSAGTVTLHVAADKLVTGLNHQYIWISTPLGDSNDAGADPGGSVTITFVDN
jgi:hypothetical protein